MKSQLERTFRAQMACYNIKEWSEENPFGYKEELRFHETRKWRFDFAFEYCKLAVEVQGGNARHSKTLGRHNRKDGFRKDCEKFSNAAILGWRIILISSDQVRSGEGINFLLEALRRDEEERQLKLFEKGGVI